MIGDALALLGLDHWTVDPKINVTGLHLGDGLSFKRIIFKNLGFARDGVWSYYERIEFSLVLGLMPLPQTMNYH